MTSMSVGDMAQFLSLSRSGAALNTSLQRLSEELVSGLAEDKAAHLSGDFGPLAGIETSLARLTGYRAVTTEAALTTDTMQAALGRVTDSAADLGRALLAGASPGVSSRLAALGADGAVAFTAAVSALNSRVGDRSLFAGVATSTTPLPDGGDLLDTLSGLVAGAMTAADVQTAIDTWFADPSGFAASYQGGAAQAALTLAPGETARVDITALDPAIADTLRGMALAALVDRGVLAGNPEEQANLLLRSGETMLSAQSDLGELTARLGTLQSRIDEAATRNAAETSALEIARSDLLSIDSYQVATALQQTQTQLETLYTLTSRLSRLSLVNFL